MQRTTIYTRSAPAAALVLAGLASVRLFGIRPWGPPPPIDLPTATGRRRGRYSLSTPSQVQVVPLTPPRHPTIRGRRRARGQRMALRQAA